MIDSTVVVETPWLAHADKDTRVSGDGERSRTEEIDPVCLWCNSAAVKRSWWRLGVEQTSTANQKQGEISSLWSARLSLGDHKMTCRLQMGRVADQ
jgi:hypothetical protein